MKPKVYTIDEHRLPHERIDDHAYYVIRKLRLAGYKAYLVGGSVRDLLLDKRPKDYDISTSATPEEIKKVFGRSCILIGRRFRLAHIRFGKKILEVATFRSGDSQQSDLIIRDNIWGSEKEDVLRRDFTINGLFYDPENMTVIDYVNGFEDVEKKLLRTIGNPEIRFKQDPVRMIRLIKFMARFDFSVEPDTLKALLSCKEEIIKSSPARILEELLRMLESGSAKNFFFLLFEYNQMDLLLPELAKFFYDKQQDEIGVFLEKVDILASKQGPKKVDRAVLLSSLLFPLIDKALVEKDYHLGQITLLSKKLITEVFSPFFHIPKRLSAAMVTILTSQYRFIPINKGKKTRMRIPKDEYFPLALDFLKLRTMIDPSLIKIHTIWHEELFKNHSPVDKPIKRRFRREKR